MLDEAIARSNMIIKENEFLKSGARESYNFGNIRGKSEERNDNGQVKELEEVVKKKNKEIYDLTVQLGALKEENSSFKKEKEELVTDF